MGTHFHCFWRLWGHSTNRFFLLQTPEWECLTIHLSINSKHLTVEHSAICYYGFDKCSNCLCSSASHIWGWSCSPWLGLSDHLSVHTCAPSIYLTVLEGECVHLLDFPKIICFSSYLCLTTHPPEPLKKLTRRNVSDGPSFPALICVMFTTINIYFINIYMYGIHIGKDLSLPGVPVGVLCVEIFFVFNGIISPICPRKLYL